MESSKVSQVFTDMLTDLRGIDEQLTLRLQEEKKKIRITANQRLLARESRLEPKMSKLEQTLFAYDGHRMR